ncbi:autophagy-related protein 2 homolog A [Echinops telfairi]|uniref:Autophagy-related protein 2 homolog A n=1 Tax=Echinops telfairi TaxID=9371 RepID=A0AC55DMZ0_ECHTE|nr:autophagy-related protein 2 homolog A [Echinops telfairi]
MSRWLTPWSNCVKERICRYLLQYYLGPYFQERLSLEQLSLDLYKGSLALRDIHLEPWYVNCRMEPLQLPLELAEGFVSSIEVEVPWASLLTDHCTVHVSGLQLLLQPRQGPGLGHVPACMTSSLEMAQECLREGVPDASESPEPLDGLEVFAQTIDSVLQRIKVVIADCVVRVEHTLEAPERSLALEVHVQRLEYYDESLLDPKQAPSVDVRPPPAFLHKRLLMAGVRLWFELLSSQGVPPQPLLQIGSCSGYIELAVKLKKKEALPGPKLEVTGQLGSLHLLLTPQQLQQLLDLLADLGLADSEGLADKRNKSRPLGVEDMWLIEQDLNQQLQAGAEPEAEPLSLDPLVNLDSSDLFFSMTAGLTSSITSTVSELSLSEVDLSSSVHSGPGPRRLSQARPAGKLAPTPLPDTLRPDSLLKITLGGVTLTLLHTFAPDAPPPNLIACFFAEFDATKDGPFGTRDFHHLRSRFQKACPHSHVRLTGTAMQLNWELRTGAQGQRATSTEVRFGQLEVLECLWPRATLEPEYTEVLSFPGSLGSQVSAQPCARLRHTQTLRRASKSRHRRQATCHCHSEVVLELADFQAEVDLAVMERLTAALRLATMPTERSPERPAGLMTEPPTAAAEQRMVVGLSAPRATLLLRFPIADLRPQRDPWAGRAVRTEQLRLELSEPQFRSELSSGPGPPVPTRLELTCSNLHGAYEDGEKPPVPCLRVSKALDPKAHGRKCFLPQVVVTLNPPPGLPPWEGVLDKAVELEVSSTESPCELREPEPSPFSSRRTMYETEEMVIPGDPEEMRAFQNRTLALSRCSLEVSLPSAHIFLPSKELYENIYNRINNDLLMWEPADLLPTPGPTGPPPGFPNPFRMCKSAFKLDSDSEDEDTRYFSVGASSVPPTREPPNPHSQSAFSVQVTVLRGRVTALCESKGEGGQRLEAQHGELVLDVEHSTLFSVSQHRGQPGLGYFCLEAETATLYHRGAVDDYPLPTSLEVPSFTPPAQLSPTIYPSEAGVAERGASSQKGQGRPPPMLSTAVRIHLDPHKNVKEFLVTMRLHRATLRHCMALPEQSWHSQLLDFLDVLDEPVLGYLPPTVITVLHTHLFSCAVDYRPLYLPVRVLITAETFTLSSNIIMDTSTFLLRFILDDSALYLSDKCEVETLDLRRDYVCVLDVDLLELVIKTWKGSAEGKLSQPLFELRCSNNVVHVHSCADSCALLVNLLQYVLSAGDLHPPPRPPSPTEIAGQKVQLSESPASLPSCPPPLETALINQRDLTDALLDTGRSLRELAQPSGGSLPQASPVSVYLFPGERSGAQPPSPSATAPACDHRPENKEEDKEEADGDTLDSDEFCILDAPGLGILPRDGEPVVTQLLPGPIVVQDGHFSRPLGSTDLLRAPAHFPVPSSRLVLREISLVWHLYGGRDFGPHPSHRAKGASPSRCSGPNRPQNSWRTKGGSGRQHHVLMEIQLSKVSFQHEVYPEEPSAPVLGLEEQPLSRQVFIVQELEVRDRLASSQINKFLYLHTSERMPRRSHSNMLTIKALHVAPTASLRTPECCLRVSLMPLRLNVDQDAIFFLKDFFTSLAAAINPMLPTTRGAASFGSSTASAALELSNRLVQAIQATAETVYDILSPAVPVSRSLQDKRSSSRRRRGQQPADLREGVAKAYDTVREGILDTAQTICDVASRGHEQKGLTGAVGGVIRQLPPTVVKPLILATEATSNLLGGMRNQILPDAHKDHTLKWRSEDAQD